MKILALILISSLGWAESYKSLRATAFSEHEDMNVRWKALVKMVEMKKSGSRPDLEKALKSKVWYMRNVALLALDSFDQDAAFEAAKGQLDDPALVVRSAAVEILAKNRKRSDEARELLWKELHDRQNKVQNRSLWIREQIAKHLSIDPKQEERQKFLKLVEEKEDQLRDQAQVALLKLQSQ